MTNYDDDIRFYTFLILIIVICIAILNIFKGTI